jgi:hypothetical protein
VRHGLQGPRGPVNVFFPCYQRFTAGCHVSAPLIGLILFYVTAFITKTLYNNKPFGIQALAENPGDTANPGSKLTGSVPAHDLDLFQTI